MATAGRGRPRPLTRGTSDLAPQLSPDGQTVAFLRGGIDVKPQLAIVAAEGGEPRIITDAPLGVDEFVWSRDSGKLAFVARMPEEGRYGTLDGVPADREDPRLIVGNKYQANGLGYTRDRPRGIYLLEVPSLDEEPWLEPRGRAATGTDEDAESPGRGCSPRWRPTATNRSSPRMGNVSTSPLRCTPGRTRIFDRWSTVCPWPVASRFSWSVVLNRHRPGHDPGSAVTAGPCSC